jgi:hypothetical protein
MKTQEDNLTAGEFVTATVAAVWLIVGAAIAGALVGGCKSIEVNKRPQTALTWTDTNGVVRLVLDNANKPVILDGGWEVDYFQHWMWTKLDTLNATAGTGVTLSLNGYESGVDSNLVALVRTSFDGAALLAAKIGAAIATSGGSAAADGVAALVKKFVASGGDVSKATVSCANGACTVTDGTVCESCTDCFAQ